MRNQGSASFARTCDNIDDTIRNAGLRTNLGKSQGCEWRKLGRLQHHRVACSQCRRYFPRQHQQRKIPRNNLAAHTDRTVTFKLRIPQLRPARMMIKMPRHQWNINVARFTNGFAIIHGFKNTEEPLALLNVSGQCIKMFGTLKPRKLRPRAKCLARRHHSEVNISRIALPHATQHRSIMRVENLNPFLGRRPNKIASDKMTKSIFMKGQPVFHNRV